MNKESERGPFYCDICDCELKDSANYLDHINGKRHNRNKGVNLKQFQDSSLEEVKQMLNKKRMERDEKLNSADKSIEDAMTIPGQNQDYGEDSEKEEQAEFEDDGDEINEGSDEE